MERKVRNANQVPNVLGLAIGELVLANKALVREGDARAAAVHLAKAGGVINAYLVPEPGTIHALAPREDMNGEKLYSSIIDEMGRVAAVLSDWAAALMASNPDAVAGRNARIWVEAVETLVAELGRLEAEAQVVARSARR